MALNTENLERLRKYQYRKSAKGLMGICPKKHAAISGEHRLMSDEAIIAMLDAADAREAATLEANIAARARKDAADQERLIALRR